MRAIRCHQLTGPSGLSVDELPTPTPGEGEVLVDVQAAGVNFPDVLITRGLYQFKPEPPFVPGGEGAGVVTAVGPNVTRLKVGDLVAFTLVHGAFAEQVVVPEAVAIKVPAGVAPQTAAVTLLTYATTYHALVDRARLAPGQSLLVLGAAGGVGVSAIQLGKRLGARVIAAAGTPEKLEFCRRMGATDVVDYAKEDLKERLKALTQGEGVDVVYDAVGGAHAEAAVRAMAWEGRFLVVGFASGTIPKLPLNLVLLKGCAVMGVFWGAFVTRDPERNRANCERLFADVAAGALKPHLHAVLPFDRVGEALTALERREVLGKLALVPR